MKPSSGGGGGEERVCQLENGAAALVYACENAHLSFHTYNSAISLCRSTTFDQNKFQIKCTADGGGGGRVRG